MSIHKKLRKDGQVSYIARPAGAPSKTFRIKEHAKAYHREAEKAIERGEVDQLDRTTQKTTVNDVIAEYKAKKLPTLARGGVDKHALLDRIEKQFGKAAIASLRGPAINVWAESLTEDGLSGHTVNHHLNCLSSLIEFARRRMGVHLPENLVRQVDRPKPSPARTRRLKPDEFEYLVKSANQAGTATGLAEIIILAVETSMRLGELLSLQWELIDLNLHTAHLPTTKNGESRTIALSDAAISALKALPRRLDGHVFGWSAADTFQKTWQRCIARAQRLYIDDHQDQARQGFLQDLRFHDLRHEAASRLFEMGLSTMEVASMTGHKSLSMLKRYTHIEAARLSKRMRLLDDAKAATQRTGGNGR